MRMGGATSGASKVWTALSAAQECKQQQQNDERQSVNGSEVQDSWQCEEGTWQQEIPALLRKLSMLFPTYLQG
jgi:hypothetical protein